MYAHVESATTFLNNILVEETSSQVHGDIPQGKGSSPQVGRGNVNTFNGCGGHDDLTSDSMV